MGQVVLLQASPQTADGAGIVGVRLAGGGGRPYVGYRGFDDWRSGLQGLPRFTTELGFDQSGWTGGALPQTAVVRFQGSDKVLMSTLSGLYWKGSRVVVRSGDDTFGPPSAYAIEMTGTIADASFADGVLQLTMSDLAGELNKPAAAATFAGTGGIEGGDDATGRMKRRSWGSVWNVEARLLDKANNIYEVGDPARPLQAIGSVKDKGRAGDVTVLAWQGSIAATFQALQAAVPPSGGAVVAPSIACIKWNTVPSGPLTADMQGETAGGYADRPTTIAQRIVAAAAIEGIGFGSMVARDYQSGLHIDDVNETVASALDRLLLPVSLIWALSPAGVVTITEWTWSGPVEALASQQVERETVFSPLLQRKLGFQRNQREQSDAEISAALLLATDATYADGTPIEVLKPRQAGADVTSGNVSAAITNQGPGATAAGSAVLNQNVTIGANGQLVGAGGGQVTYGGIGGGALGLLQNLFFGSSLFQETNGGAVASLNAFKTILGIASSFTGQGAFATLSSAAYGSSLLTGFGALSPLSSIAFGSQYLLEQSGGAQATLNAFKTTLGISSGFTGQGSLATLSSLANGSQYLSGFGALSSLATLTFGGSYLLESAGVPATNANYKTNQGTAAAIVGQGGLATVSSIGTDSQLSGTLATRLQPYAGDVNFLQAGRVSWVGGSSVESLKPQEVGSNKTEGRTAAAITGQTIFATLASGTSLDNAAFGMPARMVPYSGDTNFLAASRMAWVEGGSVQSLKPGEANANVTESRVSSGFIGQTVFATLASGTSLDNAAFGMPARMTPYPGDVNFLSAARMSWTQGGTVQSLKPGEAGANITETRVASAFTGQTVFATLPAGTSLDNSAFGMPARMVPYSGDSNFLAASRMSWNEGGTVQAFKPAEFGSNVTETRTAAAFTGQGFLATQNTADFATRVVGAEKPANNATADVALRPLGNVPPTITGNTVKGNSAGSWTGYALSSGIAGGARARALVGGGCMFGLTGNAGVIDGANTFASITYAVYNNGSRWFVYTGGNQIADLGTGFTPSTIWEWAHDGKTIRLFPSGSTTPVFSTSLNFSGILYAACAFAFAEAVTQITMSAYADITNQNTAAGFFGQAALATLNQVTFNTTTIKRADGTTSVSETLVVTELGIASAITGQGSLATLNQAGTTQIAANAVSNVLGATGDVVNVAASDTASGVSISTTCAGGAIKIDVCFDASRSSGAGQCMAQLFATYNGQTIALGRQFNCPVQVNSPPVALFVNTTFNAGTVVKFEMRYTTTSSAFQISGQAMTYTELKR